MSASEISERAARKSAPRSAHAEWEPARDGAGAVGVGRQAPRGERRHRGPRHRVGRAPPPQGGRGHGARVPHGDARLRGDGQPRGLVRAAGRGLDRCGDGSPRRGLQAGQGAAEGRRARAGQGQPAGALQADRAETTARSGSRAEPAAARAGRGADGRHRRRGRGAGHAQAAPSATAAACAATAGGCSTATATCTWPARSSASAASAPAPGWCCWPGRDGQRPALPPGQGGRRVGARVLRGPRPRTRNHGSAWCEGQWLMQAASDIFLGWLRAPGPKARIATSMSGSCGTGRASPDVEAMSASDLNTYGALCGWTLARAHARSGDRSRSPPTSAPATGFDRALTDVRRDVRGPERARLRRAHRGGPIRQARTRGGRRWLTSRSATARR